MNTSTSIVVTVGVLLVSAGASASCSGMTGGNPVAERTSAPATGTASTPTGTPLAPPPTTTVSAEDQIRETLAAFQDAYNTQNWDAYTELMCSAMRAKFNGPTMDYVKKGRAETGISTIAVTSIVITGDTATATLQAQNEALGSRVVTMRLKLEDGWKICQL
ncbi:hypothetical protein MSIMFI_01242 [Mycobacterium simulans]|uniref:Rv0361 family membrane protein n=1 Tax=Mycobacterium simulans TaxID=627089 RepID=UPI00174A96F6|nr:nuclear transport factor 2 family protein [Mycobacterium simulans]SON59758.1 hypothetical protein MSIMFI_01242 [Mycobacterium simulans]